MRNLISEFSATLFEELWYAPSVVMWMGRGSTDMAGMGFVHPYTAYYMDRSHLHVFQINCNNVYSDRVK